jgi:hypothetical protein
LGDGFSQIVGDLIALVGSTVQTEVASALKTLELISKSHSALLQPFGVMLKVDTSFAEAFFLHICRACWNS